MHGSGALGCVDAATGVNERRRKDGGCVVGEQKEGGVLEKRGGTSAERHERMIWMGSCRVRRSGVQEQVKSLS